ncbi:MAG: hypothetical protein DIJKHBIC_00517 [Thermoanaerobaculia bacterium]|nr:hypothetical protein [Thermoanaerobaculia bacterium]
MKHLRRFALAIVVPLAIPALAADKPLLEPSHGQPVELTAQRVLKNGTLAKTLSGYYTNAEMEAGVYVGSEYCIACHPGVSHWRDTKHAKAYRRPMTQYAMKAGLGVVNDYDKNGVDDFAQALDFNTISSVFDPYKPNAPKLSVESGTYYVSIGELKMPVLYTQGGNGPWKQRYVLKVPLADGTFSKDAYTSPIQFNEARARYVLYNPNNWYDATSKAPLFTKAVAAGDLAAKNGSTQSKKCIGCHTTGIRKMEKTAAGEYLYRPYVASLYKADDPNYFDFDGDGVFDILNIGCEACHGPGSNHIFGNGDPAKIANPAKMDTKKANEVCAQCHVRVFSVPGKVHEWPYKDDTGTSWYPGKSDALSTYYTDAAGRWPDGQTSKQHHQQSFDFDASGKPAFQFHPVKCTECHDPHKKTANPYQLVEKIVDGSLTIPTKKDNNTLCLACHATHGPFESIKKEDVAEYDKNVDKIGKVIAEHSHHPYAPERMMGLSRCIDCHMPKTASTAENWDIASHTFEVIAPEKTLTYQDKGGMPNSCAVSCHGTKVNSAGLGLDPDIAVWNQPHDVSNANFLKTYFGPGGKWWDTSKAGSMTQKRLSSSKPADAPEPVSAHTTDD